MSRFLPAVVCSAMVLMACLVFWGCRQSTPSATPVDSAQDVVPPPPRVDREATRGISQDELRQLAGEADEYCRALEKLGCRVSVTVNLSSTDITFEEVAGLTFPASTDDISLSHTAIRDETVAGLVGQPRLRKLGLASTQVTDHIVQYVAQMPRLTVVDIMGTQLSEQGQLALTTLLESRRASEALATGSPDAAESQPIDAVALSAVENTADAMDRYASAVSKFGGVVDVHLDFSRKSVTDADLEKLAFASCVRGVDLSYTKITDRAVAKLRQVAGLERVALMQTAITQAGVKDLLEMPNLCEANLEGTSISFDSQLALVRKMSDNIAAKARRSR